MSIDPFVAGVLCTIFCEMALLIGVSLYKYYSKK